MTKSLDTPSYDGPLKAHAGFWLRFVSNHVSNGFRQKLAQHQVTVAEWALLCELFPGEAVAPSQLAVQLGVTRGGITKIVDKLVTRGLVIRKADTQDQRGRSLSLSADGRRLVPILAHLANMNEAEFFGHLPAKTMQMMTAVLRGLAKHHTFRSVPIE